jgi:hypothetical protein
MFHSSRAYLKWLGFETEWTAFVPVSHLRQFGTPATDAFGVARSQGIGS